MATFDDLRHVLPASAEIFDGELAIGGVRASELAAAYGTPLVVYDESQIGDAARRYVRAFAGYGGGARIAYACKALCAVGVVKLVASAGLGADVASAGELAIALAAGIDPAHIVMHGNNKSAAELRAAVAAGVGLVVLDAPSELVLLAEVARAAGRVQAVLVRINPDLDVETHQYIKTAQPVQNSVLIPTSVKSCCATRPKILTLMRAACMCT